jgi:uridine kinase
VLVDRREVLVQLADALGALDLAHVPRVAVDGPDAAGKTTFADELAVLISARRPVVRLGADDFHRPAAVRYRRGDMSPEGYYLDSFDNEMIVAAVLRPLGPGGDGEYLPALFDFRSGEPVPARRQVADPRALLLFDGVFLQRRELREHWDAAIYLHVAPAESLRRALVRDRELLGSEETIRDRYQRRYLPGQAMYRETDSPADRAGLALDMSDPARPSVLRSGGTVLGLANWSAP